MALSYRAHDSQASPIANLKRSQSIGHLIYSTEISKPRSRSFFWKIWIWQKLKNFKTLINRMPPKIACPLQRSPWRGLPEELSMNAADKLFWLSHIDLIQAQYDRIIICFHFSKQSLIRSIRSHADPSRSWGRLRAEPDQHKENPVPRTYRANIKLGASTNPVSK